MEGCLSLLQMLGSAQAGIDTDGSAYPAITGLKSTCQHSRICLLCLSSSPSTNGLEVKVGIHTFQGRHLFLDYHTDLTSLEVPWLASKMNVPFRTKIEQRAKKELKDLKLG